MFILETDIWCDRCHHRYTEQLSTSNLDLTLTCPNCSKLSLLVWCATCEQRHGIAQLGSEQSCWICPTCKEERTIAPHALSRFWIEPLIISESETMPTSQRQTTNTLRKVVSLFVFLMLVYMFLYLLNSSQWFSSPQPNTSFGAITVEVKQTNVATPSPTSRTRQPSVTVAPPDDNLPSGYIVYSSNEHTKHVDQLYLLMLESGLEIRLTPYTDETKKRYLSWNQATEQLAYVSQDSAKVTFARKQHLNKYVFADAYLIVLNKIYDPILSPDGQQIAYTRNSAGEQGIFIADLDTFTEKRLSALNAVDPAWSPDGSQLVFSVLRDGQYNFMQIDITGQTIRFEYVSPLASERDVDWHPNGQELVLTVSKDGYDELYRYQIDARKLTQLTNMNSGIDEPDWSPDGNHIVFISDKSGNRDVWIIGRDGKGLRQLTDTPAREQFPIWVSEYD